ncbi:hypothetical protein [Desulfuribacillus alkaliarsenatis]|uniref:Lipoprotein n=1 Tax=Desulfuribacillus alkaliarsenatis TaxID=766136 RepID=A0A1E5G2Q9_9FIRM|nr:hypothetical protein [Desulfuribacillus alkaliarsenatis]OEF97357.1 hypothetical protein BHF68_03865 [Desulfuribacillus alkaliarsenatis]
MNLIKRSLYTKTKYLVVPLLLLTLVFAGCGNTSETGNPASSTEQSANASEGLVLELREIGFSPANLRVNDIILSAIQEAGEKIEVDKDGRFSIDYSGVVYESNTAKATVNQLKISGQISNTDFSNAGEGVGEGTIYAVININIIRDISGEKYVEDFTHTINSDYNLIAEAWAGSDEELVIMQASSTAKLIGTQDTMGFTGKEVVAIDKEENFNANYYFRVRR